MLNWLKRLFGKGEELPRIDTFYPRVRILYKYFDGQKLVTADPLVLYKKFILSSTHLVPNLKETESDPLAVQGQAYEKLVQQLRGLFSVKPLEEGGLGDVEVLQLFDHFLAFCGTSVEKAREQGGVIPDSNPAPPPTEQAQDVPTTPEPELHPEPVPQTAVPPTVWPQTTVSVGESGINLDRIPRPSDD